ncbi:hypothetical protein [Paenibacillus sp. NPDC058177]|uniref:CDI toxin immunity protein n=1 Tax=Paenibacillus sp. NPDC058177 TaxID=3346369 RepID=UPI0036DE4CA7
MTLFEECTLALGENIEILSIRETEDMFNKLVSFFPVTSWGRIDWGSVDNFMEISREQEILSKIENECGVHYNNTVFLLWNYTDAPSVCADLNQVLSNIDNVTAVGSDTWIFCPESGYVIEYFHEGQVTVGFKKR